MSRIAAVRLPGAKRTEVTCEMEYGTMQDYFIFTIDDSVFRAHCVEEDDYSWRIERYVKATEE